MNVKEIPFSNYIQIFTWLLSLILLVLVLIHAISVHHNSSIFLLFCTGSSLVITLAFSFSKRLNLFNPLIYILLTVIIGVTIRGYYMVYYPERSDVSRLFLSGNDITYFIYPTILIFLSLIIFITGYKFTKKPLYIKQSKLFNKYHIWDKKRVYILLIIYTTISIVGIYLFITSMGVISILENISSKRFMEVSGSEYETSLGYFRMLVNFASPAFFIAFVFFLVSKRRLISYLGFFIIILGFLNIAFSFFVSSRGGVVFFILNILVVLSIYNRINIKSILLGTLFAGLLFSAMTTLRPSTTSNIDQVSFNIFDPIIVNRNLLDISVTSKIYNEVPEQLEFQYGSTFLSLFVAPVPRTYWPSKPAVNPGKTIADELYSFDPNSQAGVPPGIIGELFINFGILGVFTGLLLLGIIIKKIYLYFNFESIIRKNKVILYIAVIMNVTVILFGGSINQALISFLQEFIILYMGLKFISIDINDLVSVNSDS